MGLKRAHIHIYRDPSSAEWRVRADIVGLLGRLVIEWGFPDQPAAFAQARKVWEIHRGAC